MDTLLTGGLLVGAGVPNKYTIRPVNVTGLELVDLKDEDFIPTFYIIH